MRGARWTGVLGSVLLMTGCAAGLDSVPLPSPGSRGGTYELNAVFTDALNLPSKAKVRLYGADIGEVTSIDAVDFTAKVSMRIRQDVPLPVGSTAELRSATPLGDVFLQIRPPEDQAPGKPATEPRGLLRGGDTIPLGSTAAAPTVEELLNSLAMLVNGGAIRALTTDVNGAGRVVGGRGDKLASLISETNQFLAKMTARTAQLDATLRSTSNMAAEVSRHQQSIDTALSAGAPALAVISDNTTRIMDVVDNVGRITRQLSKFPSMQGTDTRSVAADVNKLSAVFNEIAMDPNISLTAFNRLIGILVKATTSTAVHVEAEISKIAIGALPDKNYAGDPGIHGPDGTDWHLMIGSLRYEWNMLLGRIYGSDRTR
ncbi:mammalian cell entry protein [Mycolicibacterium mucogenicum DSM 44124]|uniref:MCE family protein n=1 Tax=Mycolicibacterium mucogenicum DSM 44124 TaxID=1226753 RepID=A0A8H2JE30_MYCMU|nr:mammalian cell entry protein [Mycolicibacterium mucogenicum DSM 44124]QPG72476.1 MCE family protein [Mycolicibacterium mucogenicum DSM 44124]